MSGVKWSRQTNVWLVTCLPAKLWPGGNTKQQLYSTRLAKQDGDQRGNSSFVVCSTA